MFMSKIKPNKKARKIKETNKQKKSKKCNLYFRDACKRLGSHI